MTVLPTTDELELMIARNRAVILEEDRQLLDAHEQLKRCQSEIECHKEKRQKAEREITRLQELLTIAAIVIPEDVKKRRDELAAKRERVQRKDITVAEQEALTREIKELEKHLPDGCPHPFVVGYPGYPGDSWAEWENAHRGRRMCLVCGCGEDSTSRDEDVYTTLIKKDGRIIKWASKEQLRAGLRPLEEIREAFIVAAGK